MEAKIKLINKIIPEIMRHNFNNPKISIDFELDIPSVEGRENEFMLCIRGYDKEKETYSLFSYQNLKTISISELKQIMFRTRKYMRENR